MSTGQKTNVGQNRTPTGRTAARRLRNPRVWSAITRYRRFSLSLGLAWRSAWFWEGSLAGQPRLRASFGKRAELAAEHLGRQMLDAIAGVLPESLSKHIPS